MNNEELREDILYNVAKGFISEAEARLVLKGISEGHNVRDRKNFNGHITASALVYASKLQECLFIYNIKIGKRLLPGGHCEALEAPIEAAKRELREETSIILNRKSLDTSILLAINTHEVLGSARLGEPAHLHYDFIYMFEVDRDNCFVKVDESEVSNAQWQDIRALHSAYDSSLIRLRGTGR